MFTNVEPELFQIKKKDASQHQTFSLSNPYYIDITDYKQKDFIGIDGDVDNFIKQIVQKNSVGVHKGIVGLVSNFGNGKSFFLQYAYCKLFEALPKKNDNDEKANQNNDSQGEGLPIYPIFIDISKLESETNTILLAILSEIMRQFDMIENSDKKTANGIKKKLLKLIPKAAKVVSTGMLDMFLPGGKDTIISAVSELSEEFGMQLIGSLNEEKSFLDDLKELTKENGIVIFLDNLDRCRPEFVLDLLVILQRLFSVENILFILAYDKQQIVNLLQSKYGPNVDIQSYIKKYIVYEHYMVIPTNNLCDITQEFGNLTYKFKKGASTTVSTIINNDSLMSDEDKTKTALSYLWKIVFENTTLSLRKFQQGFASIELAANKITPGVEKLILFIELLYIKSTFPLEYQYIHHYIDDIIYQGAFDESFWTEIQRIDDILYNKSGKEGREKNLKEILKKQNNTDDDDLSLIRDILKALELRGG